MRRVLLWLALAILCAAPWAQAAGIVLVGVPPEVEAAFRQETAGEENLASPEAQMRDSRLTLEELLQSFGYLDAEVTAAGDAPGSGFEVTPHERYVFAPPILSAPGLGEDVRARLFALLGPVSPPHPFWAGAVLDTEAAMLDALRSQGYPQPQVRRQVVAHRDQRQVQVTWEIANGKQSHFGATEVDLPPDLEPEFVLRRLAWRPGELYDARLVDATWQRLVRTGLFSSIRVEEVSAVGDQQPMRISGTLAPQRTARASVWYYTDGGPGVKLGWEHRNIFHGAERLSLGLELSELLSQGDVQLRFPDYLGRDRALVLFVQAKDETTSAYDSQGILLGSSLTMDLTPMFGLDAGLTYRLSRTRPAQGEEETHNLLSTPLGLRLTATDNLLDPRQGMQGHVVVEPFSSLEDPRRSFLLTSVSGRVYVPLGPKLTLALRGRSASITGTGRDRVPPDIRLYAGGPQSVRGFAYQSAGPLDAEDNPKGGLSAVDGSAELRWWVSGSWGLALFLDGGGAFASQIPHSMDELFWGAGCGLRYATPAGPLSIDAAVPVVGRRESDSPIQISLRFGQAF